MDGWLKKKHRRMDGWMAVQEWMSMDECMHGWMIAEELIDGWQ